MRHHSLHAMKDCPSCMNATAYWFTWCSKCEMVVCSDCVHDIHACLDGHPFGIPARGKQYSNTQGRSTEM
ncbi:hypothetical protein DNHGIG_28620 [Collibacillus ludicampi]|uniref:B box-type domain-containing protein n=1 Tax=Collibacillus ludicampi TaxID=2771369 RepID=A0AAV4LHW9_9BACL|nr:hypothetical protein DNHGIG_28620 [Collibacillus ludicampi]